MHDIPAYQNHPLCWLASLLCCAGILGLAFAPTPRVARILRSPTFLPTFTVGIFAWLLHGIELGSHALFWPCLVEFAALLILITKATRLNRTRA